MEASETFLNEALTPSPSWDSGVDCRVIWDERTKWLLNLNTKSVAEIEKERKP
jgi:hypothetical protein